MNSATSQQTQQLFEKLTQLIDAILSPGRPPSRLSFLNSPFMITIIGGVAVTALTLSIESRLETRKLDRSRQDAYVASHSKLLKEASDTLPRSLNLCSNMIQTRIWISEAARGLRTDLPDGRTFEEGRERYEFLVDKYFDRAVPGSVLSMIRATYRDPVVHRDARELESLMDQVLAASTQDERKRLVNLADRQADLLLEHMTAELRRLERNRD